MRHDISFFITDIDGTLTDGKIYIGNEGEIMKAFSVKDGYAFAVELPDHRIQPVVVTARKSRILKKRCEELGISALLQGVKDKRAALIDYIGVESLGKCAYFGDDLVDISCMSLIKRNGGVVGCPLNAVPDVKAIADYVCHSVSGDGAAREFVEWLVSEHEDEGIVKERIAFGVNAVKELVAAFPENGKYQINDWLTIEIKDVIPLSSDEVEVESHRYHADIQWVIDGVEVINLAPESQLVQKGEYIESRDVALWIPKEYMTQVTIPPGGYAVLYPGDAHQPCVSSDSHGGSERIRLAIAKVRLD